MAERRGLDLCAIVGKCAMETKYGVLTVSDSCHGGEAEDTSGPNLKRLLCDCKEVAANESEVIMAVVPDDVKAIQDVLCKWSDQLQLALVLTSGGTGFSPRDVTPEATRPLLDKEAPGITIAMLTGSLSVTKLAMLSRPVCGIRKSTLIVNLPGSKKGSQECLGFILPSLPHALDLVLGRRKKVAAMHERMREAASDMSGGGGGGGGGGGAKVTHACPHVCPHGHERSTSTPKQEREDFNQVALRPRHSPYPMLPVEEALDVVLRHSSTFQCSVLTPLSDGLGFVLSEDVYASLSIPPFPASVKDGYAVIAADGPGDRTVLSPVSAGTMPSVVVVAGTVSRITTGSPLPQGADAVVQVEDTELLEKTDDGVEERKVRILSTVQCGQDVRGVGFDIREGEKVLETGARLGPSELGLLAGIGTTEVKVWKKPKVAVLSTGNEVVSPGNTLGPGQIYDSNRTMLLAALRKEEYCAVDAGIATDSVESLRESISHSLDEADVLVTSGGVSMGEKDLLKPVLEKEYGATIHFGRVFMKPGKPTTFATMKFKEKPKLIFALPGNPVSSIVTFSLFVLPALRKMAGWKEPNLTCITAKLSHSIRLDPRPEYHRATLRWWTDGDDKGDPIVPTATSTGSQCSSRLLSMRTANALLVLSPRLNTAATQGSVLSPGTLVKALLL